MGSPRDDSTLTNLPQKTGKKRAYVVAALRIGHEKSKVMSNALPGKPCISACCASRGQSATESKTWKPHKLSLLFRDITKKLSRRNLNVYKMQMTHLLFFFFTVLAYNMNVSLTIWITW